MTEEEFRNQLSEVARTIQKHCADENHDIETAMMQAEQSIGLMLAEWRDNHPVVLNTSVSSGAP